MMFGEPDFFCEQTHQKKISNKKTIFLVNSFKVRCFFFVNKKIFVFTNFCFCLIQNKKLTTIHQREKNLFTNFFLLKTLFTKKKISAIHHFFFITIHQRKKKSPKKNYENTIHQKKFSTIHQKKSPLFTKRNFVYSTIFFVKTILTIFFLHDSPKTNSPLFTKRRIYYSQKKMGQHY